MKTRIYLLIIFIISVIFFAPFFFEGKLPIPSDTIVGLYHPFRDLYSKNFPRGIPFKNALITDPVRQQYPWRLLAINSWKDLQLPVWNSYSMTGVPLLANFQSAVFYPLNFILLIFSFPYGWGLLIALQILLAGIFIYLYLRNFKLNNLACLFSSLIFMFSGFTVSWMEWNTIVQTGLWLPLILLSVDKIFFVFGGIEKSKIKNQISKIEIKNKKLLHWLIIYIVSLSASFFAGHLQIFFYIFIVSLVYLIIRWFQQGRNNHILLAFIGSLLIFILITSIQWIPALQFILLSAREIDLSWQIEGWFLPWQNLIQFIAPDYFGNPTTLNYWGIWNYGEFIGYIGIFPLMMALYALIFRFDKKTFFYGIILFLSLILSLPTIFAKLPYLLQLPFISSAQPTRLMFVIDFSLAVLGGLGLDYYLKKKNKIPIIIGLFVIIFLLLWLSVLWFDENIFLIGPDNILVAKRNLYLPTLLFGLSTIILLFNTRLKDKIFKFLIIVLIVVTIFDLFRFAYKFIPFTDHKYLFPSTKVISFLQKNSGYSRIMTSDSRILPPNFSIVYKLYSIDGYDPLYPLRYGEFITALERNKPDTKPPFGFNRIITPHNYSSRFIDLMGVKYLLSFDDISSPDFRKVCQEGQTKVYENLKSFPRVFFVDQTINADTKQKAIELLYDNKLDLRKQAVVENNSRLNGKLWNNGKAKIIEYNINKVVISTDVVSNKGNREGFLVFSDSYYPTWQVKIVNLDNGNSYKTDIVRTDYNYRGVIVPQGIHLVEFYNRLF